MVIRRVGRRMVDVKTNADALNEQKRRYLEDSQWMVDRHRDQVELGIDTSLTNAKYKTLLRKRNTARNGVTDGSIIT